MAAQVRLSPAQLADLAIIRNITPDQVSGLIVRLDRCAPPPLTAPVLMTILLEALDGAESVAESLLRQLLSLTSLQRQRSLTTEDVLAGLIYGVRTSSRPWNEAEVDRWRALEPELQRLLEHPSIWRVAKALDLSYDFAYLLQDARIVSDIRPVFDRNVTRLEAAVVSFTLRLQYDGLDGNHGLSIAMNQVDVESLRAECDRALRKARLAAETMNQQAQVSTFISGSDDPSGSNDDVPR